MTMYITVSHGLRGSYALLVDDSPGFPEPVVTSPFSGTHAEAIADAKEWAECEGLPYRDPGYVREVS